MTDLTQQPIADVQAQIGRVDTKASILAALTLGALTGGAAVADKADLHGLAAGSAVFAGAFLAAALLWLGAAIWPSLGGRHGFAAWAATGSPRALNELLAAAALDDDACAQAAHLRLLSQIAVRKFRWVQVAMCLAAASTIPAAITAVLALT